MSGENEVIVAEEEVVDPPTTIIQPRNTTAKTWPAFEDRWVSQILNKLVKDLEKANDNIRSTSIEFSMQQLLNAQNFVGQAIGELRKCIGYEENNLTSEIGPRPKAAIEVVPVEDVVNETDPTGETLPVEEGEGVIQPEPEATPAINLFKTPS